MAQESSNQPIVLNLSELGQSGLKRFSGFLFEEFLQELLQWRGAAIYKEMAWNDPVVTSMLFAITMLIRRVSWRVEEASEDNEDQLAGEFLTSCQQDMSQSWVDIIAEVVNSMLTYGYSYHELVYKRRLGDSRNPWQRSQYADGRIGWRKIPIRSADTIYRWLFDDHGGVQGAQQLAPPHYQHVVIPIEKALHFRPTIEKNNPEGRSLLRGAYRCFSEDTELLTGCGWKRVGEISTADDIATLNRESGMLEYERPSETQHYRHDGDMVLAESRFVNCLVTPNHRMWVRPNYKETFEFIEAKDCNPWVSFKSTADWVGKELEAISVAGSEVRADDWIQFMAWWLAEGHTSKNEKHHETGLCQAQGTKCDEIRSLLKRLPWKFSESEKNPCSDVIAFRTYDMGLWGELRAFGGSHDKHTPPWIQGLSKRQIQLFIETYVKADGGQYQGAEYRGTKYDGTPHVNTVSDRLSDDLMILGMKAGYRVQKRWHTTNGFNGIIGSSGVSGCWMVTLGKDMRQMRASWSTVEYHGDVYCVTTRNGIVFARRDGKVNAVGQSWYMKKNIENIEAIGIERDLAGLPMALVPPEILSSGASADQKALLGMIKDIVVNVRRDAQEGIVFPLIYDAAGKPLFDFKLLSTGGTRQFDTDKTIQRYDQRIAMTILADFVLLGHEKVGSFALASSKTTIFATAMGGILDMVAEIFNRYAIPRLFAFNDFRLTKLPKIVHGDIESVDLKELGEYVRNLASSGYPLFPNIDLEKYLMKVAQMPEPKGEDKPRPTLELAETRRRRVQEIMDEPLQEPSGLDYLNDTTPVNPPTQTREASGVGDNFNDDVAAGERARGRRR